MPVAAGRGERLLGGRLLPVAAPGDPRGVVCSDLGSVQCRFAAGMTLSGMDDAPGQARQMAKVQSNMSAPLGTSMKRITLCCKLQIYLRKPTANEVKHWC